MLYCKPLRALFFSCLMSAGIFLAPPAQAQSIDPLIEGAKLCTRHLARYEREYGIPTHLLSAIAATESGRYHDGLKIRVPWPWTINAEGKGYYFESKEAAIAAVHRLRARGVQSIDIGCMQVNLMHHPQAFASLDQAFEPENNIAYAASFLRALYQDEGTWKKAAGDYHSKTPYLGNQYVSQVYNSWYQIIDKLRAANQEVPDATVTAMNSLKTDPYLTSATLKSAPSAPLATSRLPEQKNKKLAAFHSPRMNSIHVSHKENTAENGIIIVHPEIKLVDNSSVMNSPALNILPVKSASDSSDVKIIHVDQPVSNPDRKTGPTFIFND